MLQVNASYKLKTNNLKKLEQAFRKLEQSSVDLGVFDDSDHYSGFSYSTLMYMHHEGFTTPSGTEIPPRPVLTLAMQDLYDYRKQEDLRKILQREITKYHSDFSKPITEGFGSIVLETVQTDIIGSPIWLEPVTDYTLDMRIENPRQEPLVDTGDLKDKITYRAN
jgi:hypothetical protein